MENLRRAYEADLQKINNSKKVWEKKSTCNLKLFATTKFYFKTVQKIELDEEAQETLKRQVDSLNSALFVYLFKSAFPGLKSHLASASEEALT